MHSNLSFDVLDIILHTQKDHAVIAEPPEKTGQFVSDQMIKIIP